MSAATETSDRETEELRAKLAAAERERDEFRAAEPRAVGKREQRGVFQPYIFIIHAVTLAWLGGVGAITRTTLVHFALSLPALALGGFVGVRIYDLVEEPGFQRIVLGLFLLSGGVLLFRG